MLSTLRINKSILQGKLFILLLNSIWNKMLPMIRYTLYIMLITTSEINFASRYSLRNLKQTISWPFSKEETLETRKSMRKGLMLEIEKSKLNRWNFNNPKANSCTCPSELWSLILTCSTMSQPREAKRMNLMKKSQLTLMLKVEKWVWSLRMRIKKKRKKRKRKKKKMRKVLKNPIRKEKKPKRRRVNLNLSTIKRSTWFSPFKLSSRTHWWSSRRPNA